MGLRIRREQMVALGRRTEDDFLERMGKYLSIKYPDRAPDKCPEDLRRFLNTWIADAKAHGIRYEEDAARYLELCFLFPILTAVPRPNWVLDILEYPDRPADRKIRFLCDRLAQFGTMTP